MLIQLKLAWRYLSGRKLRTTLTTLAVIFGVFAIFSMNILIPSMLQAFQANMLAASNQVDLTITHRTGGAFPASMVDQVKSVDGVRVVTGSLARPVNLPANFYDNNPQTSDKISVLSLIGVDTATVQDLHSYQLQEGRFLQAGDKDACVIADSLAIALNLKLNDTLKLPTTQGVVNLTIVGIRQPRAAPGNEEVLVTLPEAQQLLEQPDQINTIEANYNTADSVRRTEIQKAVETKLGDNYTLGTIPPGSDMYASIKLGQVAFNLFGALALFMGAFIIFNTFRTIIAERRRDIGMLRAVGANRRTIIGIILIESLIQGVLGTAIGMALGYLLGSMALIGISPLLEQMIHLKMSAPVVTPGLIMITILAGVGVTLLAGLLPALSAARITPIEALRPSFVEVAYRRNLSLGTISGIALIILAILALFSGNLGLVSLGGILFLIGLVLLAPALVRPFALAFGALFTMIFARQGTGVLAEGNLTRQPTRAAITASTTMIALALVVAIGGVTTSFNLGFMDIVKKSLGSDYMFTPPAIATWSNNVGANQGFVERLQAVPGVGPISTYRFAAAIADVNSTSIKGGSQTQGTTVSVLGINPVTFPQVSALKFSSGNPEEAYSALASERAMIANPPFAANAGLKVGDIVPFITPDGTQNYRIVAIAGDILDAKITTAYISQANLAADFHKTDDIFIQINLLPGANAQAVEAAFKTIVRDYPQFTMVNGKAYADQMSQLISVAFGSMYILFAILAFPSLIAMLNTLAIAVIERTREIGMLRAVGATRAQVRRMVLTEALLLAAIGTAFGLLAGLYLGYIMVGAMVAGGFPMPYAFPLTGVLVAIAVGLLFGALAAVIPARQAARMEIVAALRYE